MNVDTYRYLMSALIQVFGALIAVDGVFLVFRYDLCSREVRSALNELGRFVAFKRVFGSVPDATQYRKRIDVVQAESARLASCRSEDADQRLANVQAWLAQEVTRYGESLKSPGDNTPNASTSLQQQFDRVQSTRDGFDAEYSRYLRLRKRIASFPAFMTKVMGVPALLASLFALCLLTTDRLCERGLLTCFATCAVVLSAGGMTLIVYWARQIVKD